MAAAKGKAEQAIAQSAALGPRDKIAGYMALKNAYRRRRRFALV
jgi:hypothetical protein